MGLLGTAALGASVRKADDGVVSGEVIGLEDGKVLVAPAVSSPSAPSAKLTGTVIGTDGNWNNEGNGKENAFDGNMGTFFDGPDNDGDWVGLDLGKSCLITQIRFAPRATFARRMPGGKFQGSNTAEFSSGVVDLASVTSPPPEGVWTTQPIANATAVRYVRYLSPPQGHCNVAEIEFSGQMAAGVVVTPEMKKGATAISLEDIAIITLRPKSHPVDLAQPTQHESNQTIIGGMMKLFFGDAPAPQPAPPRTSSGRVRNGNAAAPAGAAAAAAHASKPGGDWQIDLQGEDKWTGMVKSWSQKNIQFALDASPESVIDVPVEQVREVWKGPANLVRQARALKIKAATEDVAFIEKDGQMHDVKGLVVGIEGGELIFRFNGEDRKINLGRLVGVELAAQEAHLAQTFHQAVELAGGDVISGQWKQLNDGKIELQTPWGKSIQVPMEQVASIANRNGKVVFLSDLTPSKVEQTPYFDRVFPYRNDLSLDGGAIHLADGYFEKGVSMHSRSVLEYPTNGQFEQFKAHVGFEQPEGAMGQCAIRLVGDGRVLYQDADARGTNKPADVNVDVKGVNRLTLEVDFGEGQDVGDRVAWANARLLRGSVQK